MGQFTPSVAHNCSSRRVKCSLMVTIPAFESTAVEKLEWQQNVAVVQFLTRNLKIESFSLEVFLLE